MLLFWESIFSGASSMGIVSEENVLAIHELGYTIYPYAWNDINCDQFNKPRSTPLHPLTKELLLRTEIEVTEDMEANGIAITFTTPNVRFNRWLRCPFKVAYSFVDRTVVRNRQVPLFNQVDLVFVQSLFSKEALIRSGVTTPIEIWHHGINPNYYFPFERENRETFTFLFVGVAQFRKGIDLLLRAFTNEFSPSEKDVRLIVKSADWGNLDKFQRQFTHPQIVWRYETVNRTKLLRYYQQADCFVIPTRGDSFCLPVLEAMATGLPVIVSNWGGVREYCHIDNSYLIDNEGVILAEQDWQGEWPQPPEWGNCSLDSLQFLMRYVYGHRDEAHGKGRRAAEWVMKHEWTWQSKAAGALKILERYFLS